MNLNNVTSALVNVGTYVNADVITEIGSKINTITASIKSIANPIGILFIVILGIRLMLASDKDAVKIAKTGILTVGGALLLINLADALVTWFSTLS